MIAIAELLTILLLVLIVLLQTMDLRICYRDRLSITASLTFFSITVSGFKKPRKNRKQRLSSRLKTGAFITRALNLLLRECTVAAHSVKPFSLSDSLTPSRIIATSILSPIILTHIKANARSYYELNDTDHKLDITFSFSLLSLFISLIKASYYTVKYKLRGIGNAR